MNSIPNKSQSGLISRSLLLWFSVGLLAVVGISYATINNRMDDNPLLTQPTYAVQEGPLTISITVSGTIQAREKVVIKSELEGNSTILTLVPEGTRVKKGDLLVELDASSLIDEKVEQEIMVQNAEAAYINARENLAIVENQAKSDNDIALLTHQFALQDLQKYKDGDYPKLVKEAETKIAEASENLEVQIQKVDWSKRLFKENYLSKQELQTDELSAYRISNQLELAIRDKDLLEEYTYKRQIAQLESDVSQAKMALDRTQRQGNANVVQASAELQAKLSEFEQQKSKLKKLEDQIGKAIIYAPMDGLVVYFTSVRMGGGFRGGSNEPMEEGQTVRERQELIHLPTTSSYMAQVKVPESSLEKIRVGLPVRITVDAIPGKVYTGIVGTIAPLPDSQSIFMNPDLKVYDSQIYVDGNGEDLRSGMGCQTEIIVDYFPNATYVPVQAVLRIADKPTVYVAKGKEWEPRTVELGLDNNSLAQIKSGLKKDEIVWLTPPLSSAGISSENRIKNATDITQLLEDARAIPADQTRLPVANPGMGQGGGGAAPRMGGGPDGGPSGGPSGQGRPDWQNMTEEQRESFRQNRGQGGASGGGFGGGGASGGGRPDMSNMTEEQREQMRQRFENMTPEEREAMRGRRGQGGQGGRGGGQGGPGGQGGAGGEEGQRGPGGRRGNSAQPESGNSE